MSFVIKNDNIYFVPVTAQEFVKNESADVFGNEFTLFAKFKIDKEKINREETIILARQQKKCGIFLYKNEGDEIILKYSFSFKNVHVEHEFSKTIEYSIKENELSSYIEAYMINDHTKNRIECYINRKFIGYINYDALKKVKCETQSFSIGVDITDQESVDKWSSEIEMDLIFCYTKKLQQSILLDIVDNYEKKYSQIFFDDLKFFPSNWELSKDFVFFCDFKYRSVYKIWNFLFNGIYPQFYLKSNTYY